MFPRITLFKIFLFLILGCSVQLLSAQNDTIVLKNGNILVGEIKGMKQGVATMETSYSDSDFKIEWGKVERIQSETEFLVTVKNGNRYNGHLKSTNSSEVIIFNAKDTLARIQKDNLVFLP